MYHFNKRQLTTELEHKLLSGSVIPRPIAWISTIDESENIINIAPFSFFNVAGQGFLSVAIMRNGDKMKDTARNILNSKEAVIHIVSQDIQDAMNETSAPLPSNVSELERVDLNMIPSNSISVPAIADAKIRFETTLNEYIPVKDQNGNIKTDFFILNVIDYYFDESVLNIENLYIDIANLKAVSRLAGNNYGIINETYPLKRPLE